MLRTALALTFAFACMPASAQSGADIQPGMWEYQIEMKIPGMPNSIPPTTMRRCLTPQDVAQNKHLANDQGGKNPCTISNLKTSAGKISYEFLCKADKGSMKGTASGSASSTALDMETRLQMIPPVEGMSEMQQRMKAKRIGNC